MAAVNPLLQLRVDIHRHLRVGVADLTHHPLDVEVVGEQGDRDVGAAQGVGRGARQGRQAALTQPLARQLGGRGDDLPDTLAVEAAAAQVWYQVVLGAGRGAHAAQPLDVLDHRLDQVGAHLYLADATLGLRVGDAEARPLGVVEAEVADLQIAQLAGADAAASEDLADDALPDVAAADLGAEPAQVEADRRLGDAEALGYLVRPQPFGDRVGDQRRGRPEVDRGAAGRQRHLLRGGGVEQGGQLVHLQEAAPRLGDVDAHPLSAGGVVVDVTVLDRVVVEDDFFPVIFRPELGLFEVRASADQARRLRRTWLRQFAAGLGAQSVPVSIPYSDLRLLHAELNAKLDVYTGAETDGPVSTRLTVTPVMRRPATIFLRRNAFRKTLKT